MVEIKFKKTKKELFDMLRMYYGLPPHDGFNPCHGDGWFYRSIKEESEKAGYDVKDLEKEFEKERHKWAILRQAYLLNID